MPRTLLPSSPTVALAVGALASGAANAAWTWPHGPVRIAAGLFATALVPTALMLWPRVPVTGRPTRWIRALVMGYICGAAAAVNLAHSASLLTAAPNPAAEHTILAVLLITAVEALMVMASLARRAPTVANLAARSGASGRRRSVPRPAAPSRPARTPPQVPAGTPATGGKRATGLAWARANPAASGARIAVAAGVSKSEGDRIKAMARDEQAAS